MPSIRASVVQACTVKYDLEATLNKLESYVKLAKERDDSQLVVFPEAFIGGYPKGLTFGAPIGLRTDEGREEFLQYFNSSVEIPDPTKSTSAPAGSYPAIKRVEHIAKIYGVFIVGGAIERDGGTLYCTVIWVHPEQGLLEKRRKLMPTGSERLIWGQGSSTDVKLVTTTLPSAPASSSDDATSNPTSPPTQPTPIPFKISATICWENYMPLLRYRVYELGTQIYCAPTVDGREVWGSTMIHIALEGRCFVLSANQFSRARDHVLSGPRNQSRAPDVEDKKPFDPEEIKIAGGSMIVDPLGTILAGPLRGEEGVLTATLDLDQIVRGKYDLDVVGHYARKDIFQLVTN